MSRKKTFVALTALGVLAVTSALAMKDDGMGDDDRRENGRVVTPCSLVGVNPAAHPEIFGNDQIVIGEGYSQRVAADRTERDPQNGQPLPHPARITSNRPPAPVGDPRRAQMS